MKEGKTMKTVRTLFATASLAALPASMPASAHHADSQPRHFLAFWSDYRPPAQPAGSEEACRDPRFWEKGFVSIYSQGGYFSDVP